MAFALMRKDEIKILIVDRDLETIQKLARTFRDAGYRDQKLIDSENILEATKTAMQEQTYNFVFIDTTVAAGHGDYLAIVTHLQKISAETEIILMLNIDQELMHFPNHDGGFRFLLKPIHNEQNIIRWIESCINKDHENTDLLLLKTFGEFASASASINDILQKLVDDVVKRYEICAVILRDVADAQLLYMAAERGLSAEHRAKFKLRVGEGVTGKVVEAGEPRVVPNILDEKDYSHPEIAIRENLCSMISIPLRYKQKIFGALNVYTGAGYFHVFKQDEINLLMLLANWTAFAIHNAEKYETKEKEQKRLIEEIIRDTQSSDSLKKMIKSVLQKSAALVGGNAGYIAFVDFERMRFRPVFGYQRKVSNIRKFKIGTENEGISGDVIRRGRAEIVNDVYLDPRYQIKANQWIKSKLLVPLKYQDQVIGVLSIDSGQEAHFKQEDKRILEVLASQLAFILQKKIFDQAFRKLAYSFKTSHDIHEIYDIIVKRAAEVTRSNAVVLWEKDSNGDFQIRSSLGFEEYKTLGIKIHSDKGIISQVIAKGDAVLVQDVKENQSYVFREMIASTELKWLLCVPMFFGNEVFAVLDIYTKRPHGFFEQEADSLKALASQAGVAIENAKLIDHFNRIAQAITSSQGIKPTLESIAKSAMEVLFADPVTLFQYDQAANRLLPPPMFAGHLLEESVYVETFVFSGRSFAELIVAAGESIYIEEDIDQHPLMLKARENVIAGMPESRFHKREKIKSLTAIVLRVEEEIVGLMFLNYRTPQQFSNTEQKMMETFASYAAIAIKNSRLIEQLRRNEESVKSIFDGIPDPFIVTENQIDNNAHLWNIEFANREAYEMFGYDFESKELVGKDARQLFGQQLEHLIEALRKSNGEISNFETSFLHKKGYPLPISLSTAILQRDKENRILKTIGIAKDLSSIRELEQQKITIDKLRLTLADVGHEFRLPLHIIISQLGGLKYHLDKIYGQDIQVTKTAKIIEEEAFRAKRQMKNTLFSTVEALEARGLNLEHGLIGNTITLCADRFYETADKRGIRIIVFDSVKRLPSIYFDKTQMEQVFTNLLDNAVKYSHFNQPIEIRGMELGKKIEISLMDRGLGIPENQYGHIFQGFTRSEAVDTTRFIPGTGLGLMIAKRVVERHKGKINVKSAPFLNDPMRIMKYDGYETLFFVTLPQNPKEV